MITLQQLCHFLNEFLQITDYQDYCENGLQVEGRQQIDCIATAVTANLETIQAAVQLGVQALIVHHGLFWKGDSYRIIRAVKKKLSLLLSHEISLLSYHLPLDGNRVVGNNWKAAKDLGWSQLRPFAEMNGVALGVQGTFAPIKIRAFQEMLEEYYAHKAHNALGGNEIVRSAALVSGGAYKFLLNAAKERLDCFITGNFDEPAWDQAFEEGVNFFALGHHATEKIGPKALAALIKKKFSLNCEFINTQNPF